MTITALKDLSKLRCGTVDPRERTLELRDEVATLRAENERALTDQQISDLLALFDAYARLARGASKWGYVIPDTDEIDAGLAVIRNLRASVSSEGSGDR